MLCRKVFFFKAIHHVHVHCVHFGDKALHHKLLVVAIANVTDCVGGDLLIIIVFQKKGLTWRWPYLRKLVFWRCKKMHVFPSNLHKLPIFLWKGVCFMQINCIFPVFLWKCTYFQENAWKCMHFKRSLPA